MVVVALAFGRGFGADIVCDVLPVIRAMFTKRMQQALVLMRSPIFCVDLIDDALDDAIGVCGLVRMNVICGDGKAIDTEGETFASWLGATDVGGLDGEWALAVCANGAGWSGGL